MKTMKKRHDKDATVIEIRRCKTCNCELPSFSKHKKCDSCRRKSAKQWRDLGAAALGVVGTFAMIVLPRGSKKK